jgi:hypothetical protein
LLSGVFPEQAVTASPTIAAAAAVRICPLTIFILVSFHLGFAARGPHLSPTPGPSHFCDQRILPDDSKPPVRQSAKRLEAAAIDVRGTGQIQLMRGVSSLRGLAAFALQDVAPLVHDLAFDEEKTAPLRVVDPGQPQHAPLPTQLRCRDVRPVVRFYKLFIWKVLR